MSDPTVPAPDSSRRQRRTTRIALFVSLGLLLLLAGGAVAGFLYLQAKLDGNVERIPDPFASLTDRPSAASGDDEDSADPVTFLFLGSDSRISAGDPTHWEAGAQRTDAIMLIQLSGGRDAVTVMSIPRDSWVPIPGHGENKINAAFSIGGPALTVQTLEALTGVRIDHVAIADFESFATLSDELGGVEIRLSQPLTAGGTTLEPGTHRLDGEQALAYVRERKNVAGGDFGRVQRQQNWMHAIVVSAISRDVVTSPSRLMGFLETVSESIAVDEGLKIGTMRDLAISSRELRSHSFRFITAPTDGTGWSSDGTQSIVVLDDDTLAEVSAAFADGTIDELLEENPDIAPRLGTEVD